MDLIELPFINAPTERGQLEQLKSYLYQLAERLNFEVSQIGNKEEIALLRKEMQESGENTPEKAISTFNSVKAMIIKSADIVNAYYETINARLESLYVAESEFGTYREENEAKIEANATGITQLYESTAIIEGTANAAYDAIRETSAYIKTGQLYTDDDGNAVYGVEVGQTIGDGFTKFGRFTANRLSFYDANEAEVAYISDRKLYITDGHFTGSLMIGTLQSNIAFQFTPRANGNLSFKRVVT